MAKRRKRLNRKMKELIWTLLGFLLIAGVIFLIIAGDGAPTMKMAISKYFDAVGSKNNAKYIAACYPKKWRENYKPEGMDISLDDIVTNAMAYQTDATFSDLKIIKKEKVEDSTLEKFNESVSRIYNIKFKAKKMYKVTFSMVMNLEGTEFSKQNTGFITRYVYKFGSRWYFLSDTLVQIDMGLE